MTWLWECLFSWAESPPLWHTQCRSEWFAKRARSACEQTMSGGLLSSCTWCITSSHVNRVYQHSVNEHRSTEDDTHGRRQYWTWHALQRACIRIGAEWNVQQWSEHHKFFIKSSILVLRSQHPHGICPLAKHVHSASRADWKWSILGAVYYRSWMECTAVKKHQKTISLFIKSSILVIRSQHPHGICLLAKHVNTVHRVDHSWYILVLGLEQSVRQWKNITKRSVFIKSVIPG